MLAILARISMESSGLSKIFAEYIRPSRLVRRRAEEEHALAPGATEWETGGKAAALSHNIIGPGRRYDPRNGGPSVDAWSQQNGVVGKGGGAAVRRVAACGNVEPPYLADRRAAVGLHVRAGRPR